MPDLKKKTKRKDKKCNKEVADNYMGCLDIISSMNKWELIEVKSSGEDKASGVIMGEPRFVEFVNKAIVDNMGKKVIMEMMRDIISEVGGRDNEPTKH